MTDRKISLGGFATGLTAGVAALAFASSVSVAQTKELRMIEAGGPSGESIQVGYLDPYKKKSGINVVRENPSSLGKLQAMIKSGAITADMLELDSGGLEQAKSLGLVEALDWNNINPDPIFDEAKDKFGFGYQYYSTIMAWGKNEKAPKNWRDFWNVKDFPGKRGLPDYPTMSIPIALLADGVPPDQLFPIDLDRAFKSLEKIKDHVAVWWQAGAQPPQLLSDGEVQYSAAWSGRVAAVKEKVNFSFTEGLLDMAFFVIPKGVTPERKKLAEGVFHEMSIAENQAAAAKVVSYTGPSEGLDPLLDPKRMDEYPTVKMNKSVQVLMQPKWFFEHAQEVEERWQEFKLGL
jgi:putative spermidine/putrescine transport system substrate-binding protein